MHGKKYHKVVDKEKEEKLTEVIKNVEKEE